ncbi:retrovirus-related pol polyprotein from transposon TNT 1-94 [Tanacetum coccineum]
MYKLDPVTLAPKDKNNRETHIFYLKHTMEQPAILREIVEQAKSLNPLDSASYSACKYVKLIQELLGYVRDTCPDIRKPSEKLVAITPINKKKTISSMFDARHKLCFLEFVSDMNACSKSKSVVQIVLWYLDSGCSKRMTGDRSQLTNFVQKFLGTVKFGLGHNLFSVGQFCDSDLEVAFRKHTCFVRNLEGVDLLSGSRETNLYTLLIGDMMASSPICLLSKASKTKSCKKQSHKPKSEDTDQEKLYRLYIDLYGPMRVTSVNGKKYILFIVDDYSRFTWMKFLALKDEVPDFIIKFLKMIQVRLNATVRNIHTDNGTEFVNQTMRYYYESVGISHETSVARSPQQNGVVERRNRTLVEAARTIDDWDHLFQPMFDEYFNPPTIAVSPVPVANAPRAIDLTNSHVSTSIDQDAPSTSISSTQDQEHSLIMSQGFEEYE